MTTSIRTTRRELIRPSVLLCLLVLVALLPPVSAAPISYTGSWIPSFNATGHEGRAAFGPGATEHGQMLGLTAPIAVARADALVNTGMYSGQTATATVDFIRPFTLPANGAPYHLELWACLTGSLWILDDSDSHRASVSASARITDQNNQTILTVDMLDSPLLSRSVPPGTYRNWTSGNVSDLTGWSVPAGNYFVRGHLEVFANTTSGSHWNEEAKASFFDNVQSLEVWADYLPFPAPPIPEPATQGLLGFGLVALLGNRQRW